MSKRDRLRVFSNPIFSKMMPRVQGKFPSETYFYMKNYFLLESFPQIAISWSECDRQSIAGKHSDYYMEREGKIRKMRSKCLESYQLGEVSVFNLQIYIVTTDDMKNCPFVIWTPMFFPASGTAY